VILALWWTSLALQVLFCVRLISVGLARTYPRLIACFAALTVESLLLSAFVSKPLTYTKVWTFTRLAVLTLELLAVLEIFNRWSGTFPGIGRFGQRLLIVLCLLAAALSLSTFPIAWSVKGWRLAPYLILLANRAINAGLAVFLALTLGFFVKFGGPVAPNLWRHTWAMTGFLIANTVSYFLITTRYYTLGNTLLQGVVLVILAYWMYAMRRGGEEVPATASDEEAWAAAEEMNRQLIEFAESVRQGRQSRRGAARR
jgi:hypothetical protein